MFRFQQEKNNSALFVMFFITLVVLLPGCASKNMGESEAIEVSEADPYESLNRDVHEFNESLDEYVAKPISDAYLWVTPQFVQTGIANFFSNLKEINVVLNDVMQGKIAQGAEDSGRFVVNTTVGLAGLFDVATEIGLDKHEEDFAQTLAVWGVPPGPYLVIPVLGPMTTRGIPGAIFDTATNPATYVGVPVQLIQMLNARANAEGGLKFIDEAALDPYVFTRESFLQNRRYLITDGESEITDDVLALEDDFYEDDELDETSLDTAKLETSNIEVKRENTDEKQETTPKVVPIAKKEIEEQLSPGPISYKLKLSSDTKSFEQASDSFDGAIKSFDAASRSFEEATTKIDKYNK